MANKSISMGEKIKEIRKDRGLSQNDLSRISKVAQRLISKYENCEVEPTITNLRKLTTALQVTSDYLIFDGQKKLEVEFANPKLKESFLSANSVDKKDQETIIKVVEAILVKNTVKSATKDIE